MAVSKEFLQAWIAEHGPWAYHACHSLKARDAILAEGLAPHGDGGKSSYEDEMLPRPGHVYICTPQGFYGVCDQSFYSLIRNEERREHEVVAIDLRLLRAEDFSPDEDCCYDTHITDRAGHAGVPMPGAEDPEYCVRDQYTDSATNETPQQFAERRYRSYGDWAQGEKVGSDIAHSQECWEKFGSLAHLGTIPASALRAATMEELAPLLDEPVRASITA